ncbi:MAG: LytR C-terminal domain-containing protein [Bowdeniella nasicola]|nr:LytR C-terminal domain-containing protein [Bowdeniella nasicola]
MSSSNVDPVRERKRRLFQRQAVVFGFLGVVLAVLLIGAIGQFVGILPSPFSREFTVEEEAEPLALKPVCPPAESTPVAPDSMTINVFNGTNRTGLAAEMQKQLEALGFVIGDVGNFDAGYNGTALIRVGADQIAAGYTLSRLFDNPLVVFDDRETPNIDLILGEDYETLGTIESIGTEPFAAPSDCVQPGQAPPAIGQVPENSPDQKPEE